MADNGVHLVPDDVPIYPLECKAPFDLLDEGEKLYVHHLSKAAWAGSRVCFHQASTESPAILDLLQCMFSIGVDRLRDQSSKDPYNVSSEAFDHWLRYVVLFYGNLGNYYASGDLKFIPKCSMEDLESIVRCCGEHMEKSGNKTSLLNAWQSCKDKLFSLTEGEKMVGWGPEGCCSYYSPSITEAEARSVNAFCQSQGVLMSLQEINSRLFKHIKEDGSVQLELKIASVDKREVTKHELHGGVELLITGQDFSTYLDDVVTHLTAALPYAANSSQRSMIEAYINYFRKGDVDDHVTSQRYWVDDKGPVVETQLGFIEPYRDPSGLRGEWQGTIAIVNKETSAKFNALVENAESFLARFPWPREFEKDVFSRPDFTAVEVVAFGSTHVWAGQNLPNYGEVRQSYGFKNLSYSNVVRPSMTGGNKNTIPFFTEELSTFYQKYLPQAFEVQVGIHELLGHGSGKLFSEGTDGKLNFDKTVKHPITGRGISSWYKPGETYAAEFPGIANAMEECRADSCGLYLCTEPDLLSLFDIPANEHKNVAHTNWLWGVRSGLCALEFYSPEHKKWRQAHNQGRYAILQVLLAAGQGFVELKHDEANNDMSIELNADLIESVGRPALGEFLLKLHIYKCTADFPAAQALFGELTSVDDKMLAMRSAVLAKRQPKGVFVQSNTSLGTDGKPTLQEYSTTAEGMIQSFLDRFYFDGIGQCNG